jgi:capsular polysaccharide export protein
LQTDSQFVMYSPFRHNQELIDFVVPAVREALPGATVLVKRHPMDVREFHLPDGAVFVDGNLAAYHRSAALMVCLNSGAGFEAAVQGKPVLCFADSFYTGRLPAQRTDRATFVEDVRAAAQRGDDPAGGSALRVEVLRGYQAPGDVWAYLDEDLETSAAIVLEHVAALAPTRFEPGRAGP